MRHALLLATLLAGVAAPAPAAASDPPSWPPRPEQGTSVVHLGEEHWDDPDGARVFPKVIEEAARYRPEAVMTSSDKSSNGTAANLEGWSRFMGALDRAAIPYFAAVGNHDREAKPGFPEGVDPTGSLANYQRIFAGRPYPWGDAQPVADPRFGPRARPADDPAGASTRYAVDIANTRWVFLDNSCFSFVNCDPLQSPPFPDPGGERGQLEYLARQAREADGQGKRVFVVLHMPTQDPRPEHSEPTPAPHTMGEGTSPDNAALEQVAAANGVDGVFAGHIKGQWIYGAGGVPYFTDGGAGGKVYVGERERTGVDFGYWHGFRLVHVAPDGRVVTDAIPVFAPGTLAVAGPDAVPAGGRATWTAKGMQPAVDGAKVELELRPPADDRPNRANLPTPAHMWTTSDPDVLVPVPREGEDPRRDPARQTDTGTFAARCPGRASVILRSGFDGRSRDVTVRAADGPVLAGVRRLRRTVRRGRATRIATVRLAQPARVRIRVRRAGRTIRTLVRSCQAAGAVAVTWNGNGRIRRARLGRYTVDIGVLSDRAPATRRLAVRTRR